MTFDEYVADRGQALVRFAFVLTGQAHLAEDLVQIALGKAFRRWRRVAGTKNPDAYLRRIITNSYLDWRRLRSSTETPAELSADAAEVADPADGIAARHDMWQALAGLPPRQRAVLVLRYYADYDDRAIADLLGCTESTVRSQAARALATLRKGALLDEPYRSGIRAS